MVIDDGYVRWTAIRPLKDDTPLIVDADRVESGQIPSERLKTVARRDSKVWQGTGPIHLDQLAECHPCDRGESPVRLFPKEFLGVAVGKRLDHVVGVECS
jgi:hypothetical protein